ncbi:MAG: hypothetical protein Q7J54_02160 [Candidatus Woesearchaeota archaeon]|nr:hypothetical protein [Candidatus Woesearchaeota archaeon]
MVVDSKTLKDNAITLLEKATRAKKILQKADGKRNYKEIAKLLKINEKTISPILSLAKDLGFAEKIKAGIYKKITSNMKYIPEVKNSQKNTDPLASKVKRKADKVNNDPKFVKSLPKCVSGGHDFLSLTTKMKDAYELLYLTENFLREIIRQVLSKYPDWWNKRVPPDVISNVQKEKDRAKYNDASKKDELEYTHLGDLNKIILDNKNWKEFQPFLNTKDKTKLSTKLTEAIPMRNAVGHCIPLRAGDDQRYAEMRFKDILSLFK